MSEAREGKCPKCPVEYSTKEELAPHIFWAHEQPKYTQAQLDQALSDQLATILAGVEGMKIAPDGVKGTDIWNSAVGEALAIIKEAGEA